MRQFVKDYSVIETIPAEGLPEEGSSISKKDIIFNVFKDNSEIKTILDIGFGNGFLGLLIKLCQSTSHWHVDGIDGFYNNCCNKEILDKKYYRNIWHGLAQDMPKDQIKDYDAICLFDVIEHLDPVQAKELLENILDGLNPDGRLVISTPLFFWPQDHINAGDLEEHLIGIPAQSLLLLAPLMYFIDSQYLEGTFVLSRKSLDHIQHFVPTTDRAFDMDAGRRHLEALGLRADDRLKIASHA